ENVDLKNANLSNANLTKANLSKANLTEANLTKTTLTEACLQEAILSQAQAIGTDFTQADFTGACGLGTWNIDGTTKLDGVNCRFVYLDKNPGIKRDKRPQSGEFAPGEFTKLFQVVVNTVDLIFRNGLDLEALCTALIDVQAKQNTPLEIQNIENKGDGFVVVKVSVSEQADTTKIHSDLKQSYEQQVKILEARYQAELQGKREQIEIYKQQLTQMAEINKLLAGKYSQKSQIQLKAEKLVVLIIGEGDFTKGFPVTAQIWTNDHPHPITFTSKLPVEPKIPQLYQQWKELYRSQKWFGRITFDIQDSVTNFSEQELDNYAAQLEESLNNWLNSQAFRTIERGLSSKLIQTEEVPVIIQTKDILLQRLPWHLWDFFEHYQQAEIALSLTGNRREKSLPQRNQIRILTVLGNSTGINVEADKLVLKKLSDVETVFLVEPNRKDLHEHLWDEKGWDILCYSGHSSTQADSSTGTMLLNQTDLLTIRELKNALKKAIENGLQLAIFNSCDGLGLARELGDLHIPQMIVMREPVPDKVAQEFLKYFLLAFSNGKSLYASVREARERLEILENEFPYASWLPVIFQNSAEVGMSWEK
ncbi:MAG: pentapeptide repeat-containing protein, partial [Cyanobacteriota bacterium]|nr:pentapeptide repeat-containing protein [Cyanobacteriota bacterium]